MPPENGESHGKREGKKQRSPEAQQPFFRTANDDVIVYEAAAYKISMRTPHSVSAELLRWIW